MKLDEVTRIAANRRNFLKSAGAAGLAVAAAGTFTRGVLFTGTNVHAASYSDTDILNFALNLEYLEAEFYAVSTYGSTLVQLGVISESDTTGPTTGGKKIANFSSYPEANIATALRNDEIDHVKYLRSALGSAAAKKPAINLDALGYGFSGINSWLELARQFEDVGVSAYQGGAPSLANNAAYLSVAAAILGTEAQHSGTIRWACIMNGVTSPAVDSKDVPPTSKAPYCVDSHALSITRTPAEVLNIVYHGGRCSGGFFPNGMNGSVTCSS